MLRFLVGLAWDLVNGRGHEHGACRRCIELDAQLKDATERLEAKDFLLGVLDKIEGEKNGKHEVNCG